MEDLARRLGVNKLRLLRKAEELNRLLDARAGSALSALHLTASCKMVLCLNLAATVLGDNVDQQSAIKFSGVNKRTYISVLRMAESLLELREHRQIPDLACKFGCPEAMPLAKDILRRFSASQASSGINCAADSVQSAALYVACKKKKIRVGVTKFRDASGVSKVVFERTIALLQKVADAVKEKETSVHPRGVEGNGVEKIMKAVESVSANVSHKRKREDEQAAAKVNYAEWKRRILALPDEESETVS